MLATRSALLRAIGCVLLLAVAACSSGDGADRGGDWRPWVQGGQTGALLPRCGLTPAAAAGDSIPGGTGGIVINTEACGAGFAAAELELHDEDGMMVSFDLEPLPGGAILLRPRSELMAGVYRLKIAGMTMEPVVAVAPAELPTRLGRLEAADASCGANVELTLDPLLLEYLPQLKLSVSVDGGPERIWFDYGELEVEDGHAALALPKCFPSCLGDGPHSMRVTAELAGESGTLEPVDVVVQTECAGANNDYYGSDADAACGTARGGGHKPARDGAAQLYLWLIAAAVAVRRTRRTSGVSRARSYGPGIEPP